MFIAPPLLEMLSEAFENSLIAFEGTVHTFRGVWKYLESLG
jgi:hypothetical protein